MITHEFYGNGKIVLFDHINACDGLKKTTKCMELTADGDSVVMQLTTHTKDHHENAPYISMKEFKIPLEDLFSLMEAYIQVTY